MSAETAETVFSRVPKIARAVQKATRAIGMNILNNNEEVAGQTVFHANIPVLKDVTFEVADGELVGLIGLNGAGKSTTINEIIGLLTPYGGQIAIDGLTIQQDSASYRQKIGYIPETPSLYEELTLREHLETVLMAYGLDVTEGMARADKYLKLFRLDEKLDWFPTQFS